jgi:mannitol operon transcriptional antiterminator
MKGRMKAILDVLSNAEGYVTIEELAEVTGAGVRTIHRDLDSLERSLGFRNIRLERRRGYGVRLIDPIPDTYARQLLLSASVDNLESGSQRMLLILLYLLIETDWIKLGQIAADFRISDSSIASDLNDLEQRLPAGVQLQRQRGIGVRIETAEQVRRMLFIEGLPAIFPPHKIGSLFGDADHTRSWLMKELRAREHQSAVNRALQSASKTLGMAFSPRHELLLAAYLMLILRRTVTDGELTVLAAADFMLPVSPVYQAAASAIAHDLGGVPSDGGGDPTGQPVLNSRETGLLAKVLSALEPSGTIQADTRSLLGEIYESVKEAVERCLTSIEERHRLWLHDDHHLVEYLRVTVAAALHRMELLYPSASSLFQREDSALSKSPAGELLVAAAGEFFAPRLPSFDADIFVREAEEAILALEARMERRRSRGTVPMSVKILCYEGLGMANYLRILAEQVLPPGTVFDSAWEADFDGARAEAGGYTMVISTFPIHGLRLPHVRITPDKDREAIVRQIRDAHDRLLETGTPAAASSEGPDAGGGRSGEQRISISMVMTVLNEFACRSLDPHRPLIDQAVEAFEGPGVDAEGLRRDFERRETYGSLVFEEYGVQLMHCRTSAVDRPMAGILQSSGEAPSLLMMVAPAGSSPGENRALSEVVIALSEDAEFPAILTGGTVEKIQGRLFQHFGRLMDS